MKNVKLLFTAVILTFSLKSYCQINRLDIGIEGSPSLISIRGNPIIKKYHNSTIGFTGGIFVQYNLNKFLSIRTNINFERKGSVVESNFTDSRGNNLIYTNKLNYDYSTIPFLVKTTIGNKYKFFVNAGPYIGFLIGAKNILKSTLINSSSELNGFNSIDWGLATGLGVSIPIKQKLALSIELRNNLGLHNISALKVMDDGTIKTNSTNLNLGVAYNL
jgi:hypothetical protein